MRVVIADDSVLLREGIAQLLRREGFTVTDTVGTAEALVASIEAANKKGVPVVQYNVQGRGRRLRHLRRIGSDGFRRQARPVPRTRPKSGPRCRPRW